MAVVCALQPIPNQGAHTCEDLFSIALSGIERFTGADQVAGSGRFAQALGDHIAGHFKVACGMTHVTSQERGHPQLNDFSRPNRLDAKGPSNLGCHNAAK